ncbi:sec-independent protein translocase protein TatC [Kribbella rubisoli]|jgi:sec-independent protein translocase protein TatC|uniref:Sec-independent protein translocase protein TatC n=2 Tax=Kribbella TaxID=182639 RepID=A0A4Q7XF59_9ACTN|nr:twin-arginine translocase subunit TatC [Kribbella rubisoli]RZU22200.1 sec-independent protein translocase protein TatC [Kribbella rubisoli]
MVKFGRRKDKQDRHPKDPEGRMTLREHIVELRNRLLISVLAIVVCTIAAWFIYYQALEILKHPFETAVKPFAENRGLKPQLTFQGVGDPLTFRIKVSALLGLVVAGPIWLFQLWAFIAPGLHRSEKKWAYLFAAIAAPLFATGIALGYWTLPKGIQILLGFTPDQVQNLIELGKYLDFVIRTLLVFGIAFLIPLVVVLLNMVGVLPASALSKFRPYIILVIFVFAAVATPSGDPFTMCLLAFPMCVLFFASEVIARINDKRRKARSDELLAD